MCSVSYCLVADREAQETKKFHECKRKFQCWTGEWVARAQPRDDFLGYKRGNAEAWKPEVKAGSFWV